MDRPLALATAVAALVVVFVPAIWRYARTMITIVHEGGHALVAVLTGRRLRGIRLHSDTSGLTVARGKPRGLGMVLTLMAGYLAPSLIGLAAVFPLAAGRITLMLWITLVLLFLVLVMIRNWFGLFAVLVVGAGVYAVTRYASFDTQTIVASLGVWFLLIGGVKPLFELRGRRLRSSDPAQLASVTGVPALFWLGLMILVNGGCLAYGAWLLLA
ncbi:M50 family metallopeptidase [Hamadaea tsunoensis]|uniref:M50 family metallopeptidase n=1 Tax=Hamadaea tsunoensis TaxID=53368 RepID=UPI0004047146|nr:M50 family metallopeptidase [Hamadaea tsunoensis]